MKTSTNIRRLYSGMNKADEESASRLAWSWVIEALARSHDVNTSLLYDLIKKMLQLSGDLEINAREVVALRCLEDLFPFSNGLENDNITSFQSKIGMDSSKSCEDALHCLLQEVPLSNLRKPVPDHLKWDVQSFIDHKKVALPKCTLEQLKDTILHGSQPVAASLKSVSGLMVKDNQDLRIHLEDGREIAPRSRLIEVGVDGKATTIKASVGSPSPRNGNKFLQEKSPKSTSSLKKDRTGLTDELSPQDSPRSMDNDCRPAKKPKQATPCGLPNVEHHSDPLDSTIQSNGASQSTHPVEGNGIPLESVKERTILHDSNEQLVSGGHELHVPGEVDKPQNAFVVLGVENDARSDEDHERTMPAENQENNDLMDTRLENITSRGKESVPAKDMSIHCKAERIIRDKEIDVAMREHGSLSSQCCWTPDSSATSDWNEKDLCTRCNKGGEVLICSSSGCPVTIHESCLGFSANFDSRGKFYCPFCVYSHAISAYNKAKKQASLARKELSLFIGGNSSCQPQNHSSGISETNLSLEKSTRNPDKMDEGKHVDIPISSKLDIQRHKPSASRANVMVAVGEDNLEKTGSPSHSFKQDRENKKAKKKHLPYGSIGQQIGTEVDHGHDTVIESHSNERLVLLHQENVGVGIELEVSRPPVVNQSKIATSATRQQNGVEVDHCGDTVESAQGNNNPAVAMQADSGVGIELEVSRQPIPDQLGDTPCESISDPDGFGEGDSETAKPFRHPILRRPRKDHISYRESYPAFPQLRRKKVPWSFDEEQMLKEGMARFTEKESNVIPWTTILEFGSSVFYKGRSAGDLKDKWRNMLKAKNSPRRHR
ncbi:hypothetical protein Dimus_001974 [Dionaea muscipula]